MSPAPAPRRPRKKAKGAKRGTRAKKISRAAPTALDASVPEATDSTSAPITTSSPTKHEVQSPAREVVRELMNFALVDAESEAADVAVTSTSDRSATTPVTSRRGKGRPRKLPTAEQIETVERLAALGLTFEDMAFVLRVHIETFRQYRESHFSAAIERGKVRARMTTGAVLMREILAGNIDALRYFEKTRFGVSEPLHHILSDPQGKPVAIGLFLPPNGRDVQALPESGNGARNNPTRHPGN